MTQPRMWTREYRYGGPFYRVNWFDGVSFWYGQARTERDAARALDWVFDTCDLW